MIRVQFTGNPYMYQNDRSYNLPGITGAVQWNGVNKCFEVSSGPGGTWQRIDNTVELTATGSPDIWEMNRWIEEQKKEQAQLKELRNKYPALDEAYKHMELIKTLVTSGPEAQNEGEVQASP